MKLLCAQFKWTISCWYIQWCSSELAYSMMYFILQNKLIIYAFLMINSCMKFVSWIFIFSCTIFWHPTSTCPTRLLFCFLFCIKLSNVGNNLIFEVYRVLWILEFVDTDLEISPFTNKIFYIYKNKPVLLTWIISKWST